MSDPETAPSDGVGDLSDPEAIRDARTVRSLGTLTLVTGLAIVLISLLSTREIPLPLLGGVLILAVVGVGLRVEAAIRLRGR
ncbi:hypothetical protein [Sphaerisporangium krabiense]|uniref:Uncharacterized protein n=1 Tax=Sphaerisporangium krabiense TaxID=763782 RepID=A0A7W9DNP7_9ACTN|nr:hypothetical protein [Sphaerisporangium krabiense]MBB5625224.1 hypothetical protein [Sphaerisporangium krabiense]